MAEVEKTAKILEKHPALSKEQVEEKFLESEKTKEAYQQDTLNYEKNLLEYFKKTEQMRDEKGNVIGLIRYPSYVELMKLVPEDMREITDNPQNLSKEKQVEYVGVQFEMMSKLIVKPQHNTEWWKENCSMAFLNLFNDKIGEMLRVATEEAENFRSACKDKP